MLAGGRGAAATPADTPTVVLHVTDYAHVAGDELHEAQTLAAAVYAHIGVQLVWAAGWAGGAVDDGARHLDVVILTPEMTESRKAAPGTFGAGSRVTRRAYIYYKRIVDHAIETRSDARRVLGLVLAHETGHMLLPTYSHSSEGLMRAEWEGRLPEIPDFLPSQGAEIRKELAESTRPN
jgi:hypothetical protein